MQKKIDLEFVDLNRYLITGFYYEESELKFRKFLDIKKKEINNSSPDLMIIMMNPGGSKPQNNLDNGRNETEAIADLTQHQIIRVMELTNFNFVRILNLSDLREPKSLKFYKKINEMNEINLSHSIFSPKRKDDFNKYFVKGIPVIYAWGVNKKLASLAKEAIKLTQNENSIGIKKQKYDFAYYHPLPRSIKKQKEWYETILDSIKSKL